MVTSLDDLQRWMTAPREHERLEFKEAKQQFDHLKALRYCVALANEGGGKFVLGVTDKVPRQVVGSNAFLNPSDIASKIFEKLRFRVDVEEVDHPDGRVVVFHIPTRPRGTAYHLDGAYLMRSGSDTVAMSEDRLRRIFDEGRPDWLSEPAASGVPADDVIGLLDTTSYFDLQSLPYPTTRDGVLERFAQEKLVARDSGGTWTISKLGAVVFAKRLQDFDGLARRAPRVITYEGPGKLKTRNDQTGSRGYAVAFASLVQYLNALVPSNEVIEAALRRQAQMFPELAIRELVANALIHQDFNEVGASVMVELYSDRLEISNPGRPFIDPERFIDDYQSRNERLADLMRRLGVCEEKGSGIDKVVESSEVYQLPAPDFRVTSSRTVAVLFAHKEFGKMDGTDRVRACYQHCCLRYVMNQRMTNQTLRDRFKLPENKAETVSRIIRDAQDEKRIKLEDPLSGSKRYARYVPFWA